MPALAMPTIEAETGQNRENFASQEGDQHSWPRTFGTAFAAGVSRFSTFCAGKLLLGAGGAAAERALLAKMAALDAMSHDEELLVVLAEVLPEMVMGRVPDRPPMTQEELDAAMLIRLRQAKARLGLRRPVGTEVGHHCPLGTLCVEDCEETFQSTHHRRDTQQKRRHSAEVQHVETVVMTGDAECSDALTLEEHLKELFQIHDLNSDGLLEESEFVALSEQVALRHYGQLENRDLLRKRYTATFRLNLDSQGNPIPYDLFRRYMLEALANIHNDGNDQVTILQALILEAHLGRASLQFQQKGRVCKQGHPLAWAVVGTDTPYSSHNCDACGKTDISMPHQILRCHTCNYDLCEDCGRDLKTHEREHFMQTHRPLSPQHPEHPMWPGSRYRELPDIQYPGLDLRLYPCAEKK